MKTCGGSWLRRPPVALVSVVVGLSLAACTGAPGGPVGSNEPSAGAPTATPLPAATTPIVAGGWSGTITFHAVLDHVKDETSTSGDPGSVYYETSLSHDETRADVTDTFTVTGDDPQDLEFGISSVELSGPVANEGTTLERYVITSDKHNALGCHFTEEVGSEVSGDWSHDTNGTGGIRFNDDGSYTITMSASGDPQTGEMPDTPQLPKRLWDTFTILEGAAADCPGQGPEVTTTEGPVVEWASSFIGETDVTSGQYSSIEGQLNASNPGSVVEGSSTFTFALPKMTLTVTWHLVHDGPIVLPHE